VEPAAAAAQGQEQESSVVAAAEAKGHAGLASSCGASA